MKNLNNKYILPRLAAVTADSNDTNKKKEEKVDRLKSAMTQKLISPVVQFIMLCRAFRCILLCFVEKKKKCHKIEAIYRPDEFIDK